MKYLLTELNGFDAIENIANGSESIFDANLERMDLRSELSIREIKEGTFYMLDAGDIRLPVLQAYDGQEYYLVAPAAESGYVKIKYNKSIHEHALNNCLLYDNAEDAEHASSLLLQDWPVLRGDV